MAEIGYERCLTRSGQFVGDLDGVDVLDAADEIIGPKFLRVIRSPALIKLFRHRDAISPQF